MQGQALLTQGCIRRTHRTQSASTTAMTDLAHTAFPVNIEDEMKRSYMDYAMSVIIGRALPDVRDGLKPAHRRVLYGMRTMGLASNRAYRKCAKIVGEVMGNYHPARRRVDLRHAGPPGAGLQHALSPGRRPGELRIGRRRPAGGDAVHRGPARGARRSDDGGSRQGDRRLRPQLRRDDRRADRPADARSRTCWSTDPPGIAVGMATNIPPHNMREVIDGVHLRRSSSAAQSNATRGSTARCCWQLIPGPDFPTGGYIVGRQGIYQAYTTGRGAITMRAQGEIEESKKGDRSSIVITEIPYQVNKATADREHRRAGAREDDRRDLGSARRVRPRRHAHRHRAEARRGAGGRPQQPLQAHAAADQLRHHHAGDRRRPAEGAAARSRSSSTSSSSAARSSGAGPSSSCGRPKRARHILEGLKIALDHLDEVITLIRGSKSPAEARDGLMTQFGLSQIQAQAILDMQLQRLTGLERQKILDELAELLKTIERLRAILSSDELLMQIVVDELKAVREKYGDERRTEIIDESGEFRIEDLIADEDMAITVTQHRLHQADGDLDLPQRSAAAARAASACARARRISSATSSSRPRTPTS